MLGIYFGLDSGLIQRRDSMNKKIIWFLIIATCSLFLGCSDFFSSSGEGEIDILWRKNDSPIYIDSCFVVPVGKTLFIEPGVEVRFKAGRYGHNYNFLEVGMLHIKGNIIARGTRNDSIVFTRNGDEYSWAVICIDSTSTDKNIFQYCKMLYSGEVNNYPIERDSKRYSLGGSICLCRSTAEIKNCFLEENLYGLFLYNSNGTKISNSTFKNYGCDIVCEEECALINVEGNTFINNVSGELTGSIISYNSCLTIVMNNFNGYSYAIYCRDKGIYCVEDNTFEGNHYGVYCVDVSGGNVINNKMINNVYSLLFVETDINIINNLFTNNQVGIGCVQLSDPFILNNTISISETAISGYCGLYLWCCSDPIIYNTIVTGYEKFLGNLYQDTYNNRPTITNSFVKSDTLPD